MKQFKSFIRLPIEWTFSGDGSVLRSSIVGGYQAEIHKSNIRIVSADGTNEHAACSSRKQGMRIAERMIANLLGYQGTY